MRKHNLEEVSSHKRAMVLAKEYMAWYGRKIVWDSLTQFEEECTIVFYYNDNIVIEFTYTIKKKENEYK